MRHAWTISALAIGAAGVAVRVHALGRWGFLTDEAWVALMTRAEDMRQLWMAVAVSPVGWAGLVWLSGLLPLPAETTLRVVPCVAGCLGLWVAHRGGARFAGHPLGGVAALAIVASDPLSVGYAKFLKPYTTEVLLCLVAISCTGAFAESWRRRDLVILVAVLCLGLPFSQAHLLLGPPLLGALALLALARGEGRRAAEIVVAAAVVGIVAGAYYVLLIEPRMGTGLDAYWSRQTYLPPDAARALDLLWERGRMDLERLLGPWLVVPGLVALVALAPTSRRRGAIVLGLALLVLELALLSTARMVPVNQPRVLLFAHVTIASYAAAALGTVVHLLGRRSRLAAAVAAGLAVAAFAVPHPWRQVGRPVGIEEVRSLVRVIETQRRPSDRVLVHQSALFPYAYHQRRPVRLYRAGTGTGFLPDFGDRRAGILTPATVEERTRAALRDAPRVWIVASRMRPPVVAATRRSLERAGHVTLQRAAPGAVLFLVVRRRPTPDAPAPGVDRLSATGPRPPGSRVPASPRRSEAGSRGSSS